VREFRDEVSKVLQRNLVGAYLYGSIAFPDYEPRAGDIDFYAVIRRPLNRREIDNLDQMHRTLAARYEDGRRLDGFYIPLSKTRKSVNPRALVYGVHGRVHRSGSDDAWALHREHFHGSAYIRLHGPQASSLFPSADWHSIRSALYRQLAYSRKIIDSDPWWAVLNLCRIVYSFKTGRIAVSKLGAADWALREFPSKWHPLIRSAIRTYRKTGHGRDNAILRRDARRFLGFASVRAIAFGTVWDTRAPPIAHLRNRSNRGKR
jgi:hypothetical protein